MRRDLRSALLILALMLAAVMLSGSGAKAAGTTVNAAGTTVNAAGTTANAAAGADGTAEEARTEFPLFKESDMLITLEMNEGDSVQVQVNLVAPIVFAGLEFGTDGLDCELTGRVYRWDRNLKQTLAGGVLYTETLPGWALGETVGMSFAGLSGGALPAGEYVLEFTLTKGHAVTLDRYMPQISGVNCFDNAIHIYGSFRGRIDTAEPVEKAFHFVTLETDLVYHTAPPEWTVPEDSAIAQMGVDPTQWTAVDGLGRTLPDYTDVGQTEAQKEKKVGIFYWTWHYNFAGNNVCNVNRILEQYPEAKNDYYHEIWKTNQSGAYFWNEPIYGYYTEFDDYVLRNHAELLADAGIDFVLFDCTNGDYVWEPAYMNLLKVWSEARADGIKTPQIGFMMQFAWSGNTRSSLYQVYTKIYKPGLYQDLWFYWEGKPLVMAHSSGLDLADERQAEMAQFFTFRAGDSSYFGGNNTNDWWGWLHMYPQALYKNDDGTVEMTTVGIAMNANSVDLYCSAMNGPYNMGRSYSRQPDYSYSYKYRGQTVKCYTDMENSKLYGINFQEQWDYALSVDPEIIFVTGWNEWIAGRNVEWGNVPNGFPDECDDENSRDIEPSTGDLKDYYYYQLVANVRRFKGASKVETQPRKKSVDIHAGTGAWDDPAIVTYNHYVNNRYVRDADGWKGYHYTNSGTRNDIKTAKVAYDRNNIYFYVETVDALTSPTDANWMRLLLDTQAATANSKDWEEFEFIVNRVAPAEAGLVIERSTGGWNWETVGYADYTVDGNVLQLTIPRRLLGLRGLELQFNFKWCDNNLADGDIMTLYTDGDAAPGGRFCFRFTSKEQGRLGRAELTLVILCAVALAAAAAALAAVVRSKRKQKEATQNDGSTQPEQAEQTGATEGAEHADS